MFLFAFILSSSAICFSVLLLFDQHLGIPWSTSAPRALIATVLGHWIFLLWLYRLGRGKG